MQNDCLDGVSDDGLDALVVGRRRELDARPQPGRSIIDASALVLSASTCAAGVYRRLERVSGQYPAGDRKSTRLNSSHTVISYAGFCLKKKNVSIVALPRTRN